jgi:hypothetical protein
MGFTLGVSGAYLGAVAIIAAALSALCKALLVPLMGAAFLLVSPTAHADKQGFVEYIHSQSVPPAISARQARTTATSKPLKWCATCSTTAEHPLISRSSDSSRITTGRSSSTAQRFVCPDTLHYPVLWR